MSKPRISRYTHDGSVTHVTAVEIYETITVGEGAAARQVDRVIGQRRLRTAIAVPDEVGEARDAAIAQLRSVVAAMSEPTSTPERVQAVADIEQRLEQEAGR